MATDFSAPTGEPEQPQKRPKVVLWKWSLIITGIVLTYLMWSCGSALYHGKRLADGSIHRFHQQFNAGEYEDICREGVPGFSQGENHDEMVKLLRAIRTKLGNATSESMTNLHVNATTNGTFVETTYDSTFEKGKAKETFTWLKSGSALKLYGYNIQSNALIAN
ncbi:MAG TPA: hypothetical protein VEX69_07615 [Candidatus Limnocylindria bacterium]|nr:hypothetical protein [Candidatus Limnocylindria bacterium]